MNGSTQRFHVLTGGPGSGKSSVLAYLETRGHAVAPEAGRGVIREELARGGDALPWADRVAFARRMAGWEKRNFVQALAREAPTFFDRGLPDTIGYCRLEGLAVSLEIEQLAAKMRYSANVFIAPPWAEIYVQDTERKQSWEVAVATHKMMVETYRALGYTLVELPKASIEQRAAFILNSSGLTE